MKIIEAEDSVMIDAIAASTGAFKNFIQEIKQKSANGTIVLFGALVDGEYVGRICLKLSPADEQLVREKLPGVPQLIALQVNDNAKEAGVGTELCTSVFNKAKHLGYKKICLGVEPDNKAARALYEKLKFEYEGSNYESCWDEPDENGGLKRVCVSTLLMVKELV